MKNVHLIAACGVGMASLAGMLKEMGCRVSGSDANVYPPMSTQLESLGIRLASPYAAENIPPDADLVVVGNAVSRGNPEAQEAARRGVPTLSMPQAVARFFIGERESIVVAGTHGKTTATSLAAWSLFALGADPSFLVGGVPKNFPVSYRLGQGRHFVIEGDEYDTAYFDKGPKFLHYRPRIVLLTSVEFDHADIYRDLDHVRESFRKLAAILPPDGLLVACADYPDVVAVSREARCPVVFYATRDGALPAGSGEEAWAVRGTGESGGMTGFRMEGAGRALDFRFPLPGLHNAANAAGVAIVLMRLGFLPAVIARTFERFAGIRRRQEVDRGVSRDPRDRRLRAPPDGGPGDDPGGPRPVPGPADRGGLRAPVEHEPTEGVPAGVHRGPFRGGRGDPRRSVRGGKDPARRAASPRRRWRRSCARPGVPRTSSPRWTGSSPASRKRAGRATSSSSCRTAASAASRKSSPPPFPFDGALPLC